MDNRIADTPTSEPQGQLHHPNEDDPAELDDPAAGSPDREPERDSPRQRPITDNKAGG